MKSPIEVRTQLKLDKAVTKLLKDRKDAFERAIEAEKLKLIKRTRSGRDVDGATFAAYTSGYEIFKARSGRGAKWSGAAKGRSKRAKNIRQALVKLGHHLKPDLTFKGRMLANITHKVSIEGFELVGRIFFKDQEQANKARGNMEKRKFFLLSQEQIDRIKNAFNKGN